MQLIHRRVVNQPHALAGRPKPRGKGQEQDNVLDFFFKYAFSKLWANTKSSPRQNTAQIIVAIFTTKRNHSLLFKHWQ